MEVKTFRPAIIRMHERKKGVREIARDLGISPNTVSLAIKRFEETGSNNDRKRGKIARSQKNIQRAKGMIGRNKTTKVNSTRKLAKKLGVGRESARKILREDLHLKSYKLQKRQKLDDQAKQKRLDRCRALLRRFSRGRHRQIIFSDEKLFDIQQVTVTFFCSFCFFSHSITRTIEFGQKRRRIRKRGSSNESRRLNR